MTQTENEKMARYIWHDILQRSIKTLSWGVDFSKIYVIEGGTKFHVQGFLVKGTVEICYQEGVDLFKVTITPDDTDREQIIMEDVYADQLVDLIDEKVEHCENYEKRVCEEYGITQKVAV